MVVEPLIPPAARAPAVGVVLGVLGVLGALVPALPIRRTPVRAAVDRKNT